MFNYKNKRIPLLSFPNNNTKIIKKKSKMACLNNIHSKIECSSQYYIQNIVGATEECYIRIEVAEKLCKIADFLPKDYKLKILDSWRSYKTQKFIFDSYLEELKKSPQYSNKNYTEEDFIEITKNFVSYPSKNPLIPFVHSTGGAVDLTLTFKGQNLDMGSTFDEFSECSNTAYFENSNDNSIPRDNRRLLYNIMVENGFTNLPSEWWHYDYGDGFWAYYNNTFPFYEGIYDINDVKKLI